MIALDRQRVRAQRRHLLHHSWLLEGVLSGFNHGGTSMGKWQEWVKVIRVGENGGVNRGDVGLGVWADYKNKWTWAFIKV
ncbi:hypothetical protein Tco_1272886 [Tanacetum coccineum]